jgi:hypothetical protein
MAVYRIPGPENTGTHRANRAFQYAGNVFVTQAVVFAQQKRRAQFFRQRVYGFIQGPL